MTPNTQNLPEGMVDLFPYEIPDGFHPGTSFSGIFINVFIANTDNMNLPFDNPNHEDKPKYAFSCAIPVENRKTQCREMQSIKFSCNEEDYKYLKSVYESLKFQAVNLVCFPGSWGNSPTQHGVYYRYVSNSLRRFDGKLITDKKGG
ncbi:hypothetical protein ATT74_07655 [Salmonella enterica subsp. enterica serovar Panama]|uniref:Uncharacterized protein n=1 Tax=Salmonella enterica subsp. enterica serovar Panama TaxID=29472 RepID=A0A619ACY2_SALET|nr:hypothetical protein [Salmonella enterica subsp. enterica serovar Panama]EGU5381045.1 hypothetical protein [Salmonella enterica]ECX3494876.1 hypothetical protein [Salmonella enterica subsp. enterica serovar Panama]ECX6034251.1 hypothetical protein [Salmonella enterica subsp. enterica serovar Panama]EGX1719919.1 hypothetical protein [Salmonella enterica subsp. enterica serovar Panama]